MAVKAFQYTNLLSAMLLDSYARSNHGINPSIDAPFRWAIPVCMIFTWVWMRTKFHWTQYLVGFKKHQWHKFDNLSRVLLYPVLDWDC